MPSSRHVYRLILYIIFSSDRHPTEHYCRRFSIHRSSTDRSHRPTSISRKFIPTELMPNSLPTWFVRKSYTEIFYRKLTTDTSVWSPTLHQEIQGSADLACFDAVSAKPNNLTTAKHNEHFWRHVIHSGLHLSPAKCLSVLYCQELEKKGCASCNVFPSE